MTIMGGEPAEAAVQVLEAHRLRPRHRCTCGHELKPGVTHAAHVAHEIQMAGIGFVWR